MKANPNHPDTGPAWRATISNEEINELPLGQFEREISLITDPEELPAIFRKLRHQHVVGFDTETKPVFVKGQRHKVALMQIGLRDHVYLIRLKQTGMTDEILDFLQNPNILKVGAALRDDVKALQHLKHFAPGGFVELTELSKKAGIEVESVKKLTAIVLGFRISKSAQTSNWEAAELNEKQLRYAATDAWVCLSIYEKLIAHL
ncbi:MAG: 3'-5' exonuclease [Cyclobacteriaceae bacterium]